MLNQQQIGAIFERGNNFVRMGNLAQAVKDYDQVLEHWPEFAPAYFNRAFARQHGYGDLPGAIRDYTRALQLKPDFAEAYANRGIAHHQNEDYLAALADYDAALELDPESAPARYNRGEVHFLRGDFPAALADFQRARELRSGYSHAIAGAAIAAYRSGDAAAAKELWSDLLARDGGFKDAVYVANSLNWDAPLADAAGEIIAALEEPSD